jgi:hypothetical protein
MDDGPEADFSDEEFFLRLPQALELLVEESDRLRILELRSEGFKVYLEGSSEELLRMDFNFPPFSPVWYQFVFLAGERQKMK